MDVHAPHEPIHTWRDFATHLIVVTIGLFIALSLEAFIEHVHQRHLVHIAHQDLHIEIQSNRNTLAYDEKVLAESRQNITQDLQILRTLRNQPTASGAKFFFGWTWDGLRDSAWQSARDTGALALMNNDQVQHYSAIYAQQSMVADTANSYINADSHIGAPLEGDRTLSQLTPQEIDEMIHSCADTLIDIDLLQALMRPLEEDYAHAEDTQPH